MKLLNKANIKQFISYFFVGGVAAIVEWVMFFIFANVLQINYFVSTVIAFIFSTTANWILLKKKGITTYALREKHLIDSRTIRRLKENQNVTINTITKLCSILECDISDIVEYIPDKDDKK